MTPYFEKTALIIGAGAHVPYGFPTGETLRKDFSNLWKYTDIREDKQNKYFLISENFNKIFENEFNQSFVFRHLPREVNSRDSALMYFLKKFGKSREPTIDRYLSTLTSENNGYNKAMQYMGKSVLIATLIYYESLPVYTYEEDDWIEYILNQFLTTKEEINYFFNNPPKIITFNYDNHLERMLKDRLESICHLSPLEAIKEVEKLNILHIYGDTKTLYDNEDNISPIDKLKNIYAIGEERSDDTRVKKISNKCYDMISQVNEAYFMGYGFDEINNSLLFSSFKEREPVPAFYSTDIFGEESNKIVKRIPIKLQITSSNTNNTDCLKLIKNKKPIFTEKSKADTVWCWPNINKVKKEKDYIRMLEKNRSSTRDSWMG